LNRRNVLEHEGRSAVYRCIKGEPGVRFTEILAKTGLNRGTAEYHLHVLEQTGKIRRLNPAGYSDASRPAVPEFDALLRVAIRSETARKILEYVARRKAVARTTLSSELGLSGPLLSYHLERLVERLFHDRVQCGADGMCRVIRGYDDAHGRRRSARLLNRQTGENLPAEPADLSMAFRAYQSWGHKP